METLKLEEPAPIHCKYKKTMVVNLDYYTQQNYLLKLKGEKYLSMIQTV